MLSTIEDTGYGVDRGGDFDVAERGELFGVDRVYIFERSSLSLLDQLHSDDLCTGEKDNQAVFFLMFLHFILQV
ncbi:hypothetical protein NPIL_177721 [Nephila pilipes]|uniref:Uncharacterized protein n=1 Tax=Nephila pilipes TaxID=299642 RepID=A0A8X6NTS3_NEPPI|nr:hypothetical protein NPIL_177721 [Nephila pilipes]